MYVSQGQISLTGGAMSLLRRLRWQTLFENIYFILVIFILAQLLQKRIDPIVIIHNCLKRYIFLADVNRNSSLSPFISVRKTWEMFLGQSEFSIRIYTREIASILILDSTQITPYVVSWDLCFFSPAMNIVFQ